MPPTGKLATPTGILKLPLITRVERGVFTSSTATGLSRHSTETALYISNADHLRPRHTGVTTENAIRAGADQALQFIAYESGITTRNGSECPAAVKGAGAATTDWAL